MCFDWLVTGRVVRQNPATSVKGPKHIAARELTEHGTSRIDVLRMIKRRAKASALPPEICRQTFRATGITACLHNGGTLEKAQQIAAHSSPRTTKLYDRTNDELPLDAIKRIQI